MTLFNTIRSMWGIKASVEATTPIEELLQVEKDLSEAKAKLSKAQQDFDSIDGEMSLKIKACDVLIEKGSTAEGEFNKKVISDKLSRITDSFLNEVKDHYNKVEELEIKKSELEGEIIAKSIDLTSRLNQGEQESIKKSMDEWKETGLIKGEKVGSQIHAMYLAVEQVAIGDEFEKATISGGSSSTESGKDEYVGHYVNAIIRDKDDKILFLKRASDDDFEPGKLCVPGGKIEAGESLDQALKREVKEETNIEIDHCYCIGKIKCTDGKWAFYYECNRSDYGSLALLDGESENGFFFCEDEWMEADLLIDLKDHLQALKYPESEIKEIKLQKAEDKEDEVEMSFDEFKEEHIRLLDVLENGTDEERRAEAKRQRKEMDKYRHLEKGGIDDTLNPFQSEDGVFFLKAKALPDGTERTWGGVRYRKVASKWKPIGKDKSGKDEDKHSSSPIKIPLEKLSSHAENTSSDQLKKIVGDESKHPHLRDAAKRELERRKPGDIKTQGAEQSIKQKDTAEKEAKAEKKKQEDVEKKVAEEKATKEKQALKKKEVKKPAFSYSPSETLFDDSHKKIEEKFGKHLTENYKQAKKEYTDEFGSVLNTDSARELSKDYLKNRAGLSAAVHEPASAFIKKLYEDMLAKPAPSGKKNLVYFTAGGTGAGKSSSLIGDQQKFYDKAHIVYDTNMNRFGSAKKKIDQAIEAGKKVIINYTFRDPIDAFENGAIPRSIRVGRTVPIEEHINTHLGSMDSIQALKSHYKDNPGVKIIVTDNSKGKGGAKKASINFVKQQEKNYIASDLREKLHSINEKMYAKGAISKDHYVGFKGHNSDNKKD